jgi:hypothetical protein
VHPSDRLELAGFCCALLLKLLLFSLRGVLNSEPACGCESGRRVSLAPILLTVFDLRVAVRSDDRVPSVTRMAMKVSLPKEASQSARLLPIIE